MLPRKYRCRSLRCWCDWNDAIGGAYPDSYGSPLDGGWADHWADHLHPFYESLMPHGATNGERRLKTLQIEKQKSAVEKHCQKCSTSCPITQSGDTTLDEWIERIYTTELQSDTMQNVLEYMCESLYNSVVDQKDDPKGKHEETPCIWCGRIKNMLAAVQR